MTPNARMKRRTGEENISQNPKVGRPGFILESFRIDYRNDNDSATKCGKISVLHVRHAL